MLFGKGGSAVKMLNYRSKGCEFKSQHASYGPLSKAFNPAHLYWWNKCKSLWIPSPLALHFQVCIKVYSGCEVSVTYFKYLHSLSLDYSLLNNKYNPPFLKFEILILLSSTNKHGFFFFYFIVVHSSFLSSFQCFLLKSRCHWKTQNREGTH